ncbi:MAG: hypothetical protein KKD44_26685 [Proteobacteria bacterium]|nr:hypothetical protein [Pseudomonadota bacterium]
MSGNEASLKQEAHEFIRGNVTIVEKVQVEIARAQERAESRRENGEA